MIGVFALTETFERVADDYTGPVLYEVAPRWRAGRGRWWRPGRQGYTDNPSFAGIYAGTREILGSETSYAVSAHLVLACMDTVHAVATKDLRAELAVWAAKEGA